MFGYITTNMEEMKIREYRQYHAFYCGICQDLKEFHGQTCRLTLTYDMTFLAILLTGLYEKKTIRQNYNCLMHPLKKHLAYRNVFTAYAADMNVLLSYFNLLDDWVDEKKLLSLGIADTMQKDVRRLREKYPRQCRAIVEYLKKLRVCEQENSPDLDRAAGYTGDMLAEIFVWKKDRWEDAVRGTGYAMGKFIYLMDAFEDVEKDKKNGNYNPWLPIAEEQDFYSRAGNILTMLAAHCSREFEKLPIVEYVEILRNILYSGIWTKYDQLIKKDKENSHV